MDYQDNNAQVEIERDTHLVGFIRFETSFGTDGQARDVFKAQFRSKAPRTQTENGWERGEPEDGYLHVTGPMAEIANSKFRDSDAFIATGDKYTFVDDDGKQRIVFYADDIGHNTRYTNYAVDRTQQREQRRAWQQERDARREQEAAQEETPEHEPEPSRTSTTTPVASADGLATATQTNPPAYATQEGPPPPPQPDPADALAAREALMQNEQSYPSAAQHAEHEAPAR